LAETSVVREVYDSAMVSGEGGCVKSDGRKSFNDPDPQRVARFWVLLCLVKFGSSKLGSDSSDGLGPSSSPLRFLRVLT
jgi:hypothetical protein